jgi:hypothetical protein
VDWPSQAKFNILGLCSVMLPPTDLASAGELLSTLPVFLVPSDTQVPPPACHQRPAPPNALSDR